MGRYECLRSLQNTNLHRAKKCLGLIHTSSFLAKVHFPCFSEMAYCPAPRAAFSALQLLFVCLPLESCLNQLSSRRQQEREHGASLEFSISTCAEKAQATPRYIVLTHLIIIKNISYYTLESRDLVKAKF